jgi:predicted RNA-binding protein YlqC (UPF0109 family)
MKYFVEFVVSSLVQYAEEVDVQETETDGTVAYKIRLNPADIGRVIGKKGRTIGAIRNLLNSASKTGKRIVVEVMDEAGA